MRKQNLAQLQHELNIGVICFFMRHLTLRNTLWNEEMDVLNCKDVETGNRELLFRLTFPLNFVD